MARNPFRRKSKLDKAQEGARKAAEQAQRAAEQATERAAELRALAEPQVEVARRRPWRTGAVVAGAVAAVAALAKALRGGSGPATPGSDTVGSASVTPTAPSGPTDERLNDPALKAKVESELFRDDDVPKEKISIDVADGIVTLRGQLGSTEATTEISARAESVEGVRGVENLLTAPGSS